MKKVLMIAYSFPPAGGGRVRRVIKFVKYLRNFGWEPIVLTVKKPVVPHYDYEIIKGIPEDIKVIRTGSLEPKRLRNTVNEILTEKGDSGPLKILLRWIVNRIRWWIFVPDSRIGWIPFAVLKGTKIIKKEEIDLIFVIAEPYSSLLSGVFLKKLTGKPLVVDFRDEWVEIIDYYFPEKGRIIKKIEGWMEAFVIRNADTVVSVTRRIIENFRDRYSREKLDKFVCITNGYDPSDFVAINPQNKNRKFTVTYAGSLYRYRSPEYFLMAIKELFTDNPEFSKNVKLVFLGDIDKEIYQIFSQSQISDVIDVVGFVNYLRALEYLSASDVLLYIEDQIPISERLLPAKIFEYMGVRKPIFALAGDGSVKDVINYTHCGVVVPSKDIAKIKEEFRKLYEEYKSANLKWEGDETRIREFSRIETSKRLSELFNRVLIK